jgi:hypothetical protein
MDAMALDIGFSHLTVAFRSSLAAQPLQDSLCSVLAVFPTFTGRIVSLVGVPSACACCCTAAARQGRSGRERRN